MSYDNVVPPVKDKKLWRKQLKSHLATERARFLWQYRSIDETVLAEHLVIDDWTPKDLLAHVGLWDAFLANRMQMVGNGLSPRRRGSRLQEIQNLGDDGMARRNAKLQAQYKSVPLEQALAICLKERSGFNALLKRIPDDELHQKITFPWGEQSQMSLWATWRYQHDADHTNEMLTWRQQLLQEQIRQTGPKYILRAILKSTRKAFESLIPLIAESERNTLPVCGVWTVKDVIGHLTDWEKVGVHGLLQVATGHSSNFDTVIDDFDTFNSQKAALRRGQSWAFVWSDFNETRQKMLDLLEQIPDEMMSRPFQAAWGSQATPYYFATIFAEHEMEHAADVQAHCTVDTPLL